MQGGLKSRLATQKSAPPAVAEEVVLTFLRRTPPFQFLDEATLRQVATRAEIRSFPQGTLILRQGEPAPGYLYVIERGGVKKSLPTETEEQILIEVAGEGELFDVLSSLQGDISRMDVSAVEDTICYAIPQPVIQELLQSQSTFANYLLRFSIEHYLDWSLAELRQGDLLGDTGSRLLFTRQLRDLAYKPLVTCAETTTIQRAAQLMTKKRVSSVVVVDAAGRAAGILTDWDLRERVIAAGLDSQRPVREVMSAPVITLAADELAYEAVRLMITHNLHHLVITEDEQPVGMVTGHDLIVLQSSSALFIAREIDHQVDSIGLRQVADQAHQAIPALLQQGVRAGQLGWLMADINDRLVGRAIELTEAALGTPPVPYCWLALGSEGRREQTIKTDQDNALLYIDSTPETAEAVRTYFLEFGRRVVATLVEAGFPPCQGHYTADNPLWVQPLSSWSDQFRRWMASWELEELVDALIFFDFRGVYGDLSLAERLWAFIVDLLAENPRFLHHLAHHSTSLTPPLGFLGHLILEHSGEHKQELDLKLRGAVPIIDLARFFALRHGLSEKNTLRRLELLQAAGHLPADLVTELTQAFEFMLHLRLRHQWTQVQAGLPVSNHINPQQLSALERSLLRESFKAIARAQAFLRAETHVRVGRLY